MDVNQDML